VKYILNQLLIKLDAKRKMYNYIIKMWCTFIFDLLFFNKNNFFIFSNQSWHYGWDYENRKKTYINIFNENSSCINIDLNNKLMMKILLIYLRAFEKTSIDLCQSCSTNVIKDEIFCRNFWDVDKNKNRIIPVNTSIKYNLLYKKWCKRNINKFQEMYLLGDNIFSFRGFKGLIVSQFGYEDWAWASLCLTHNKRAYTPEGNFGFTCLGSGIERAEANYILERSRILNYNNIKNGVLSLKSRCNGNFKSSAISYYMDDIKKSNIIINPNYECDYIFYLHAFGDSPNNAMSEYLDSFGIDYFDSTLKILEEFIRRKTYVAIKLHPLSSQYSYDNYCNKIIDGIVTNSKYLHYCESFPLSQLKKYYPNATIITGRGSVISEACFLGLNSFSFCKSVYSEMGMTVLINNLDDLFDLKRLNKFRPHDLKLNSVRLEAVKIVSFDSSIFSLSNYTKTSVRIRPFDTNSNFLESDRVVNL